MTTDPLGILARASAASLLMITPEYWKVRSIRSPVAGTLWQEPSPLRLQTKPIQVGGQSIRMASNRQSNRPTVVFLSPLPQSLHCYESVWNLLEGEADLLAVDLPGFGGSEGRMDQMNFEAQSAFLEAFIEHLGLEDVHLVAPDIAMPVALHYVLHRTHRVASILIGDGPGVVPSADGSLIRKIVYSGFWRAIVRANGIRTFLATAIQVGYLHYSPTAEELRDYIASYAGRVNQILAYFASYPEGFKTIQNVEDIPVPVQVFWGDTDAFLGCENAHHLHERLPDSELRIFNQCGHFSYQDKPEEFAEMVRNWIHARSPAGASSSPGAIRHRG